MLIVRMNVDNNTNKFDATKLSDKVLEWNPIQDISFHGVEWLALSCPVANQTLGPSEIGERIKLIVTH